MVRSRGKDNEAFFASFMVGDKSGGMIEVEDKENKSEVHKFFDLKGREVIVRDILSLAEQVDSARLRLNRTELSGGSSDQLAQVFVRGGVIGEWSYELVDGELDNDLFRIDSGGGLFLKKNDSVPVSVAKSIRLKAHATDGTGVVIERSYSLWLMTPGQIPFSSDLDPSFQPSIPPPLVTPRPNRTH